MALMPKRTKHRKCQRGSRKGCASSGAGLEFGEYGLKCVERAWLKAIQIEACRVAITRHMKRKGKLWVRVFPDKPVSKKPIESRQGKGKGDPEYWVAVIKPGMMLFEMDGVSEQVARESLRLAATKLPVRTLFVARHRN